MNQTNNDTVRIRVVPTEVYSRIVGYFRPVQNWNPGKAAEFADRHTLDSSALEAENGRSEHEPAHA